MLSASAEATTAYAFVFQVWSRVPESRFCIKIDILCFLIGIFTPFIFNAFIDVVVLESPIYLFVFHFFHLFFVTLSFPNVFMFNRIYFNVPLYLSY